MSNIARPGHSYNYDVERALIGVLIMHPHKMKELHSQIMPEYIQDEFHRATIGQMIGLYSEGKSWDLRIMSAIMGSMCADGKNVAEYLTGTLEAFTASTNAVHYARYLSESYKERCIAEVIHNPAMSPVEKAEAMNALLRDVGVSDDGSRIDLAAAMDRTLGGIEAAHKNGGAITGVCTGLTHLDEMLGGMEPGELYVMAGRPAMGKTAIATTCAINAAAMGTRVLFFSLEMPAHQLCHRMIARQTSISSNALRRGNLPGSNSFNRIMDAAQYYAGLPFTIIDKAGLTAKRIAAIAMSAPERPKLIVIDHLAIVAPRDPSAPRVQQITEMTAAFKALAKDMNCPVLLLHQLNRGVEGRDDKRPSMSDLRDSGSVEQDAGAVMLLYREEYYLRDDPVRRENEKGAAFDERAEEHFLRRASCKGKAELIVAKNRQGEIGTVHLRFDGLRQYFEDLS